MDTFDLILKISQWFFGPISNGKGLVPSLLSLPAAVFEHNPFLILFIFALPLVGLGIGIIRRIIRIRG